MKLLFRNVTLHKKRPAVFKLTAGLQAVYKVFLYRRRHFPAFASAGRFPGGAAIAGRLRGKS
jgi:hypothetical protein